MIGPWGHGPSQKIGALDFGPEANVDALAIQLRWYDYWLKGIDNGLFGRAAGQAVRDGPQRVGATSANIRWRARSTGRSTSPAAAARTASRRRAPDVGRSRRAPHPPDRFRYDPDDPVPSVGGNNCCGTPTPAGPQDQRPIEGRRDVLLYTSDILQEELEVTGPVKVVLLRLVGRRRHRLRGQAGGRASRTGRATTWPRASCAPAIARASASRGR